MPGPEHCSACGATVRMRRHTGTGKRAPIDVEPAENGNVVLVGEHGYRVTTKDNPANPGELRYVSHFATCPDAQRFRGGGGPRPHELPVPDPARAFGGETYDPDLDHGRLTGTLGRVYEALLAQPDRWWTLHKMAEHVAASEASVSARFRDLRKPQYGRHAVERRRVTGGLFEYRLSPSEFE